jgi:hypothetical protein
MQVTLRPDSLQIGIHLIAILANYEYCCVDTGPNCCNNQSQLYVANNRDFVSSASLGATRGMATTLLDKS